MYSICTQYILTVRRRSEGKTSGRHVIVTPFYLPCRLGSARALTDSRPLRCRLSLGLSPHDRPGKTNEGAGCGWASFRLPPPRDVAATLLSLSLCLSLSLLHTWSWRGGQERGDLTLSPGGKSASGARREKSLGRKRNQRRRANYHFACSARRLPRHAPCPSSLLPRIEPRHHSILATEHPAARSIERTCICLYTVSIFIRAVLFAGPYVTWRAVAYSLARLLQ